MDRRPRRARWRIAAAPHDLVIAHESDVDDDERGAAMPGAALARKVDGWLRDPARRAQMLKICRDVFSHTGTDDAAARQLRRAFELGRLVAFRLDRVRASGDEQETAAEGFAPGGTPEERLTWIEIELVDTDGRPAPGQRYRITLPDGEVREGRLDAQGLARVEGIDPGACEVTFPDFHEDDWRRL